MAGYWEIKEANKVVCGILHTDNTTIAWALGLRNLIIPGPIIPVAGMPYDMARNTICQQVINGNHGWCFFLDSDVIPPRDAVLRLLSHNLPIVSGVYHRRSPPHGVPVMLKGGTWVTQYPPNSLIEVDVVGSGCLLIRRDVIEKFIKEPQDYHRGKTVFDWRVDMQHSLPKGEAMSEDFTFCLESRRRYGLKIMVDTGVQCRHVGSSQATYGSMLPLETIPNT